MATRRSYLDNSNFFYQNSSISDTQFEFDESELWNSNEDVVPEQKHPKSNSLPLRKPARRSSTSACSAVDRRTKAGTSLPVNVPDWSKIPREDDDNDDDNGDDRIPPHVYLARTRMASLSVHEGVGRTLKGRDLSRVRDAVWKKIGFED